MGVRELSVKTGLTPNLTHWYLKNLERNHVARKDPGSDKYELGYRVFELGNRNPSKPPICFHCGSV